MQETAQSSTVDSGTRRRGRLPVLTVAVLAVTVAVTVVAHSRPAVFHALRRDPHALRSGQWWRLLSPVLVQADRPALAAGTFVLVFLVGAFFEWRFGRARWLLLYLVGAVSGHSVDEVPLREYADRFHPPILYYQGANAMLRQLPDRKFDAVRRVYPHNGMALGL